MGKSILTPKQLGFLELAQAQTSINKNFYLTGGTALSEFYFQHRLSEDIDLFSEKEIKVGGVESFLQGISTKIGISEITRQQFLGLNTYKLKYADGDVLKIDFNYYPFPKIETGVFFKKLEVSSIYDIAVNKIHTVGMKPRTRDYVDLFFIFTKSDYPPDKFLHRMRIDSQAKFDWPLEAKNLAVGFTRVKDLPAGEFPNMLVPLDKKRMEEFFLGLAKSLEADIFKFSR